ncbi:MAG: S4 domain-containing protein [Pseudomonadota bacterium]
MRRRTAKRTPRGSPRTAQPERLQKVLAAAGLCSRREAEEWIRAGRLTVNGKPATLGVRVLPTDQIRLDGRLIRQRAAAESRAYVCHRSPGEDLRSSGEAGAVALIERLPRRSGRRYIAVSPMPRIDGGLELVTSDGELAARLQRSVRHLTSEFSVRVHGELREGQIQGVLSGVLDRPQPLEVERCDPAGGEGSNRWYTVVARGASGRDIRQLFERQGAQVSRVLRTRFGPLVLERSLPRGHFREVTNEELTLLLEQAGSRSSGR